MKIRLSKQIDTGLFFLETERVWIWKSWWPVGRWTGDPDADGEFQILTYGTEAAAEEAAKEVALADGSVRLPIRVWDIPG